MIYKFKLWLKRFDDRVDIAMTVAYCGAFGFGFERVGAALFCLTVVYMFLRYD